MELHPIFKIREEVTPEILELLNSVTLGTEGAHYRHLDTDERIHEADQPLYLTMERNGNVIANLTFCRRGEQWYIRYFAFSNQLQGTGAKPSSNKKSNLLRRELDTFFDQLLQGDVDLGKVDSFYAYIDPKNQKSLWMSENFGFKTIGTVATQTFSRISPKKCEGLIKSNDWNEVKDLVVSNYAHQNYFYDAQVSKGNYYSLKNDAKETIAFAKISTSVWEISRLPGRLGKLWTRLIPFIPGLNKLIRPNNHAFIVPEAVYLKDNDPLLLEQLFNGILHEENKNLILWWADERDPLYMSVKDKVNWGLLHKFVGISQANIVQLAREEGDSKVEVDKPVFTSGYDFI